MVRKTPSARKRPTARDSFFDHATKHEAPAGGVSPEVAARLERQIALLRQEHARLAEENQRLKDATSLDAFGYCELDARGMILEANAETIRLFQSDLSSLQGIAFVTFLQERFHQKFLSFLHHAFHADASQTLTIPVMLPMSGETELHLVCRARERAHGRVVCCVIRESAPNVRSESAAHPHEEHFRTIVDHSADAIMWISSDGSLVWINQAVEALTGYTPEECYGLADFPYVLFAASDRETVAEVIAEGLRGGEDAGIEAHYRHKDKHEAWGMISYYPIFDEKGNQLGFCMGLESLTLQKELEEDLKTAHRMVEKKVRERTDTLHQKNLVLQSRIAALNGLVEESRQSTIAAQVQERDVADRNEALNLSMQFFEQVINALGDPVIVKNCEHRFVLVNKAFVDFTGVAREAVIGHLDHELFSAEEADRFIASDNAVLEQRCEYLVEEPFTRRDGERRRVMVKKDLYIDERGESFIVGVLRDVTELRNAEDEMRTALGKEKELNELKSRFVSLISHEYKTPLTAILSSAELLELFRNSWTDEKINLHLQKIKRAVETMTEMLSDAIFLNKLETSRVQIAPTTFELVSFCIMIADEIQAVVANQCVIETSSSATHALVCTDNKLLRYILTNILSNAVKYSYPRTGIQFETVVTEQAVTFRIRNRGTGIPPENQARIYEPFFRASNTGTIQGSGLGLSIVKHCVESLAGTIECESILNETTTFTVTLPLQVIEYHVGIGRSVIRSLYT